MSPTRPNGFTMVEVMIVTMLLAVLGALVLPTFRTQENKANAVALCTNLRGLASAANVAINNDGFMPQTTGPNMPAGLEPYMSAESWAKLWEPVDGTHMGLYNAILGGGRSNYVVVSSDASTMTIWQEADSTIDDGDGNAGNLRVFSVGDEVYALFILGTQ